MVKKIWQFLSNIMPNTSKNLTDFGGEKMVVDASHIIYKYSIAMRKSGDDIKTSDGRVISHLIAFLNNAMLFLRYGIVPIYVFDGKATTPYLPTDQTKPNPR